VADKNLNVVVKQQNMRSKGLHEAKTDQESTKQGLMDTYLLRPKIFCIYLSLAHAKTNDVGSIEERFFALVSECYNLVVVTLKNKIL
jgi:hypothetical protein